MRKKIFRNWGLKLASLLLAAILWFLVIQLDDPKKTQYFYNIPVTLVNTELLERENKFYEVLERSDSVRVTVTAPTSIIAQLRSSDIVAEADVSRLTDINTIPITYSVLNVGVDSNSIKGDHDVVRLNIERKKSNWVKVEYKTIGEVAEGFIVAGTTADQTQVEVTGPESAVDQIDHAVVEMDVTGANRSQSANVEVLLYDKEDNVLEFGSNRVLKNVNYIHMTVEVLAVKTVPVEASVSGTPAAGYLTNGVVECSPDTVRIAGSTLALGSVNGIKIPEEQLNLDGAEGNVVNAVDIRDYLPDNIKLADSDFNGRVIVTVHVEPEVRRTLQIPLNNVDIVNVPEMMTADPSGRNEYYELKVSGLDAAVSPVDQNAIRGTVDVAAWMEQEDMEELTPGTYEIPIDFGIASNIKSEGEVTARVTFSKIVEE